MTKRAEGLKKDIATLAKHPDHAVTLGRRRLYGGDAVMALSDRLDTLPLQVSETLHADGWSNLIHHVFRGDAALRLDAPETA